MFKVNNRNTKTRYTPCFSVSIVNFEQVNAGWEQTNFSTKEVPVGLDFTVAKGTAIVLMHISKASCKLI